MITRRAEGLDNFIGFSKALAVTAAFWVAYAGFVALRRGEGESYPLDQYLLYWSVALAGFLFAFVREETTGANFSQAEFLRALQVASREWLYIYGALGLNLVLTQDVGISRLFLVAFGALLFVALVVAQRFIPRAAARWFYSGSHRHPLVLVGPSGRAEKLVPWLREVAHYGVHPVALFTDDEPVECLAAPTVGRPEALPAYLQKHAVGTVLLLEPLAADRVRRMLEWTDAAGCRLVVLNTLAEDLERPLSYYRHAGVDFIGFRDEPLQEPTARVAKRVFDLALATFACVTVLPPLMLLVWIMQRRQAPGPLFFRQERAGLQNRSFRIFKFRTMRVDNPDPTKQATAQDDRIYPFGALLRRTSLDEIPQFLNVLAGDMSVVGPRPHMVEHNARFATVLGDYHVRTFVRPGVTGLAQISGYRGEAHTTEDIRARVRLDIDYIEHWSLGLDLKIVLRTILQVVRPPKSAY